MELQYVALICFVAITACCAAGYLVLRDLLAPSNAAAGGQNAAKHPRRTPTVFDEEPANTFTGRVDQAFDYLILESGFDIAPLTAFLMVLSCGLAVGGAVFVYYGSPLAGIAGAGVGMTVPLVYLIVHRGRRMHKLRDQFPHLIDLLARSVRAGYSLDQAIAFVGQEIRAPLGNEFSRCSRQLEMGMSVSASLQALARRVRLVEMNMLATMLTVHRQTGGNLPRALERLADVVRDRLNYRRQMRASTGAGRASTLLIAVIAPALYIIMFLWQPNHIRILVDDPNGQMLLMAAIALELIGLLWVAHLLRTDY